MILPSYAVLFSTIYLMIAINHVDSKKISSAEFNSVVIEEAGSQCFLDVNNKAVLAEIEEFDREGVQDSAILWTTLRNVQRGVMKNEDSIQLILTNMAELFKDESERELCELNKCQERAEDKDVGGNRMIRPLTFSELNEDPNYTIDSTEMPDDFVRKAIEETWKPDVSSLKDEESKTGEFMKPVSYELVYQDWSDEVLENQLYDEPLKDTWLVDIPDDLSKEKYQISDVANNVDQGLLHSKNKLENHAPHTNVETDKKESDEELGHIVNQVPKRYVYNALDQETIQKGSGDESDLIYYNKIQPADIELHSKADDSDEPVIGSSEILKDLWLIDVPDEADKNEKIPEHQFLENKAVPILRLFNRNWAANSDEYDLREIYDGYINVNDQNLQETNGKEWLENNANIKNKPFGPKTGNSKIWLMETPNIENNNPESSNDNNLNYGIHEYGAKSDMDINEDTWLPETPSKELSDNIYSYDVNDESDLLYYNEIQLADIDLHNKTDDSDEPVIGSSELLKDLWLIDVPDEAGEHEKLPEPQENNRNWAPVIEVKEDPTKLVSDDPIKVRSVENKALPISRLFNRNWAANSDEDDLREIYDGSNNLNDQNIQEINVNEWLKNNGNIKNKPFGPKTRKIWLMETPSIENNDPDNSNDNTLNYEILENGAKNNKDVKEDIRLLETPSKELFDNIYSYDVNAYASNHDENDLKNSRLRRIEKPFNRYLDEQNRNSISIKTMVDHHREHPVVNRLPNSVMSDVQDTFPGEKISIKIRENLKDEQKHLQDTIAEDLGLDENREVASNKNEKMKVKRKEFPSNLNSSLKTF